MSFVSSLKRKVVFFGDKCSGKNAIITQATKIWNEPENLNTGFSTKLIQYKRVNICLQICDTAGEERYYPLNANFVDKAIVIFVFSLANENSFNNFKQIYNIVKPNLDKCPFLFLVGNRNDLVDDRVISNIRCKETANEINAIYFEVSSKDGNGIDDLFYGVAAASLKFGLARLVINSIKFNFQESNPFCPYIEFTYNGLSSKQTQQIENCVNPEWNETIDFLIDLGNNEELKINMFKSKDGHKLID